MNIIKNLTLSKAAVVFLCLFIISVRNKNLKKGSYKQI